jgi:branched-chain amino acid transport system substrate-binding protein
MRRLSSSRAHPWLSLLVIGFLGFLAIVPATAAAPPGAPPELKVAFVDFLSGPAATFGVPSKNTAVWLVDNWNRDGGIRGVKIKLLIVDEAGTPDKQVTEYRRLVLDEKVNAVVGYTSSANCLALAPVAEELKALTVIHVCGTRRLTEDHKLKYVFRTSDHQAADSVMGVRYVLSTRPDVKTIAGANEDYAWGRDSWDDFKDAMLHLRPGVKVVTELWTKIQAGEYSGEISKLLAANPEVIHSSFWGGGLVTFVKQAAPRGLFKDHVVYLSTGEQALQDLKKDMPEGVIVGPRATAGYFLYPEPNTKPLQSAYVHGLKTRFNRYPDYPSHRTYQALAGLRAAYEKAMDQNGGRWPNTEQVIMAFEGLTWQSPYGSVTMRPDHQAVHAAIVGITRFDPLYGFDTMSRIVAFKPEEIMPPLGVKTHDWLKTLK